MYSSCLEDQPQPNKRGIVQQKIERVFKILPEGVRHDFDVESLFPAFVSTSIATVYVLFNSTVKLWDVILPSDSFLRSVLDPLDGV